MARAIWSGALNFGLVTVPVELYSAVGDHSVRFRQFERGTSDRIRYRRVNERTGKEEFEKPYGLLMKAMAESNKAGIARFVMRGKEYIAAIRASEHVLVLDTLRFAEDVRDPVKELRKLPKDIQVRGRELEMAMSLIDSMADDWNPEDYEDTYTERVHELIESKRKGQAVVTESEPPSPTQVVDLFEALSRSVASRREKKGEAGGRDTRRKRAS